MSKTLINKIRKEIHEVKVLKEISKEVPQDKSMAIREDILKKDDKIAFLIMLAKEMEKKK